MNKVVSEEIKQRRRINVMLLKSMIAKLKVLLLAALIFVPAKAWAGGILPLSIADTDNDTGVLMLFGVFDQREGNTRIQFTNTDQDNPLRIHVQIFDVSDNCRVSSFFDNYTKADTHVYDFSDMVTNDGQDVTDFSDPSYGIFVATMADDAGNIRLANAIGNLSIARDEGYEYRTNLNGLSVLSIAGDILGAFFSLPGNYSIPFDSVDGNNMSDVYGIAVLPLFDLSTATGTATVSVAGNIFAGFSANLWDENEQVEDCPPVAFMCDLDNAGTVASIVFGLFGQSPVTGFDLGINGAHPASREGGNLLVQDGANICSGPDAVGQVILDGFITAIPPGVIFSGFYGLNNGEDTGSMDTIISTPFSSVGFLDLFGIQPFITALCSLPFVGCF
jgi:hypothetical protein